MTRLNVSCIVDYAEITFWWGKKLEKKGKREKGCLFSTLFEVLFSFFLLGEKNKRQHVLVFIIVSARLHDYFMPSAANNTKTELKEAVFLNREKKSSCFNRQNKENKCEQRLYKTYVHAGKKKFWSMQMSFFSLLLYRKCISLVYPPSVVTFGCIFS